MYRFRWPTGCGCRRRSAPPGASRPAPTSSMRATTRMRSTSPGRLGLPLAAIGRWPPPDRLAAPAGRFLQPAHLPPRPDGPRDQRGDARRLRLDPRGGPREPDRAQPQLDRAFQREALATAAIQREWTVSLGCRSGIERLAHLFCECAPASRRSASPRARLPAAADQHDLAHSLGQTSVHINRTHAGAARPGADHPAQPAPDDPRPVAPRGAGAFRPRLSPLHRGHGPTALRA